MGLHIQRDASGPLVGIGGTATVLGHVTAPVKIGTSQVMQLFTVIDSPLSGYGVLLGQDYLRKVKCTIEFTDTHCQLRLKSERGAVSLSRPLHDSVAVHMLHCPHLFMVGTLPSITPAYVLEADQEDVISSLRDYKSVMRAVESGSQVAYRIMLHSATEQQSNPTIRPIVQSVIDNHSGEGGTLGRDIPLGAHATGYEMKIDLVLNARSVQIKPYRLTPKEEEALLTKAEEFIKRGWIEPSTSSWNSAVLLVPKPNGSLRFCVDFRFLNERTLKDKGNIPFIQEL